MAGAFSVDKLHLNSGQIDSSLRNWIFATTVQVPHYH